jgi:sugar phosphate isomerase/epimerase
MASAGDGAGGMSAFKISACSANYGHADLFAVVDRLAELDYDGVEITVMYHAVPQETSSGRRAEILRRVKDVAVISIASARRRSALQAIRFI